MINVLKETTITVKGKEYCLQLLHDDTICCEDACDYCYYRDWNNWGDCGAYCSDVHGCDVFKPTYFKLTDR